MPGCLLCVVMNNVIFSGQHFLKVFGLYHKSAALVCGARAQNQATKLFRFFREDDGYNETFAVAKWQHSCRRKI